MCSPLEAGVLISLLLVEVWSCSLLIFAWNLSGKKCLSIWDMKCLSIWDTFLQSTFTIFSEKLREAFLPPGIEPKVGVLREG